LVKCAHGETVGELDKKQLFYAAARGLDPVAARALLLEGFIAGLWDEIEGEDQGIADLAREALRKVAAWTCSPPSMRRFPSAISSRRSRPAGIISTAPPRRKSRRR